MEEAKAHPCLHLLTTKVQGPMALPLTTLSLKEKWLKKK